MVTAYDYDTQQWVKGEPARLLKIRQCLETLGLLEGPNGDAFHRFTRERGVRSTLAEAIAAGRAEVAKLREAAL
jgi:nucleoid-associated protein YejK